MFSNNMQKDTKPSVPTIVMILFACTVTYKVMVAPFLKDSAIEEDCEAQANAGGMISAHCLELGVFQDWHKKGTEDLLAEAPAPAKQESSKPALKMGKGAMVVDASGETFAHSIAGDLEGLEKQLSELAVVDASGDVKYEAKPQKKSSEGPRGLRGAKNSEPEGDHITHEQLQAKHKERVARRAQLKKDIEQRMEKLHHGLTDLVSDHKAWESTFMTRHHAKNLVEAQAPREAVVPKANKLRGVPSQPNQLKWSNVPSSSTSKKDAIFLDASQKQSAVVNKADVRHLTWVEDLPKVAAIAWIRGGRKTRARLTYFVDNFALQDYEGRRQLVLVYHAADTEAAELLRQYANSTDVKIVAAHDSQDAFPSDAALRYAAWSADADVMAQWDFDEWHDPSRLSTQIRAMAYKAKRACVLSVSSTSHKQEDEDKEISMSSVAGTRTWMKAHWHPFSKRPIEASQLVELDMQNKNMMDTISHVEHTFTTAAPVEREVASQADAGDTYYGTKFAHDIDECLGYDHSHGHAADDAAEKAILQNVGPEFGKKFHDLVKKRRDITSKLQLLCFQASTESDAGKRKFMHEHVIEMDHIRDELDKHVHRLAAIFGAGEV